MDQSSIPNHTLQISLTQTMAHPPRPSLSTSECPGSRLSGVCIPPLLVTLPANQAPSAVLSLNLHPVGKPNRCATMSTPTTIESETFIPSGSSHCILPISQMEGVPLPLLHLHVLPTSEMVHRLSQLKWKTLKGPIKRLT